MTSTDQDKIRAAQIAHAFVAEHFEKLLCGNYDEDREEVTKWLGDWVWGIGKVMSLTKGVKLVIKIRRWSAHYYAANFACPSHSPLIRLDLCQCLCQCLLEFGGYDMESDEWQIMQAHYDIAYTAVRYAERNVNKVPANRYQP